MASSEHTAKMIKANQSIEKLNDWITPQVNLFQQAHGKCEDGMGETRQRTELVEGRLCERLVRAGRVGQRLLCKGLCFKRTVHESVVCVCAREDNQIES